MCETMRRVFKFNWSWDGYFPVSAQTMMGAFRCVLTVEWEKHRVRHEFYWSDDDMEEMHG